MNNNVISFSLLWLKKVITSITLKWPSCPHQPHTPKNPNLSPSVSLFQFPTSLLLKPFMPKCEGSLMFYVSFSHTCRSLWIVVKTINTHFNTKENGVILSSLNQWSFNYTRIGPTLLTYQNKGDGCLPKLVHWWIKNIKSSTTR